MRLTASQTSLSSVECTTSIPRSGANSSSSGGMTNASHSPGYRRSTSAIHSTLPRSTIAVYGQPQSQETPHSAEPHLPEALRPPCSAVVKLIITGMQDHPFLCHQTPCACLHPGHATESVLYYTVSPHRSQIRAFSDWAGG